MTAEVEAYRLVGSFICCYLYVGPIIIIYWHRELLYLGTHDSKRTDVKKQHFGIKINSINY